MPLHLLKNDHARVTNKVKSYTTKNKNRFDIQTCVCIVNGYFHNINRIYFSFKFGNILKVANDPFWGVRVEMNEPIFSNVFDNLLQTSISYWEGIGTYIANLLQSLYI